MHFYPTFLLYKLVALKNKKLSSKYHYNPELFDGGMDNNDNCRIYLSFGNNK